jgi:hypothetical protein
LIFDRINLGPTLTENSTMAERGIPDEISDAFGEALVLLIQWRGGADEPSAVLDGKSLLISLIFELVARRAFKDKIPVSMLALLQAHAVRDRERQKDIAPLTLLPTYGTAAQCLMKWVSYKKSKWTGK